MEIVTGQAGMKMCGYSVERDFDKMSKDRGDFLLHPVPLALAESGLVCGYPSGKRSSC